ncbi:DUF3667 domain-containing protein [Longimicrobium terrae]|uniref:DUF3667 domain-containing protein n=1 Tax=Longimicrobium terrae TaxID=1639882 RepID=A0A841GZK7_9BACT|nr:DUF3667 domain-containing protein [Longimicrobium terrae]MBB4636801.1 hypothetical protein [Longimicrobium terrae]MBB6071200.1 hypothetical protein [Longimicrobium terrae]NNC29247.1 DUF3667 domain-containing protein [Longimicrobium terrae]
MSDPIHPPRQDPGPHASSGGLDTAAPPLSEPAPARPRTAVRNRWWSPDTRRTPDRPCLNCGNAVSGNFCPNCGQRKADVRVSLRRMMMEVLDDQLSLNSALPRTMGALLFRPGHLTSEYVQGRIVRYIPPFRIYLVASLLFFIVLPWVLNVDRIADQTREARLKAQAEDSIAAAHKADSLRLAGRSVRRPATAAAAAPADGDEDDEGLAGVRSTRNGPQLNLAVKDTTQVPALLKPLNRHMLATEARLEAMPTEEVLRLAMREFLQNLPTGVFLLMPVFAMILKVLYFRRKRFYVEHFVFALHVHGFAFLLFTAMLLAPWTWLNPVLQLWFAIYLYWAMKRVYGQGWMRTLMKYGVLVSTYMVIMLFEMLGVGLATAFMM